MNRNKKGFSIIEVLFSIAIISLVIVMVIIFYSYMMTVSAKGVDITIASQVAESKLNEVAGDKNSDLRKQITDLPITPEHPYILIGRERNGKSDYYWLVKISAISGNNYSTPIDMELFFVDVLVFWWAGDVVTTSTTDGAGNSTTTSSVNVANNMQFLNRLKNKFENVKDVYISDSDLKDLAEFKGMTTNLNEGYKFVRLSRIISKDV